MELFDNIDKNIEWYYLNTNLMELVIIQNKIMSCNRNDIKIIEILQDFMSTHIKKIDDTSKNKSKLEMIFMYGNYEIIYEKEYKSFSCDIHGPEITKTSIFSININGSNVSFDTTKGAELIRDYILRGSRVKRCDH